MISDAEHFFMSIGDLYVLFEEVSIQVLCSFFKNCIVCFLGVELCKFFINSENYPLSDVSLANMFSHNHSNVFANTSPGAKETKEKK